MQITLLRHGNPDFEWSRTVKASEIKILVKAYDSAGITDAPSHETIVMANNHNFIVCSDLRRSLDSAKAMGVSTIHLSDLMFREMNIPSFDNGFINLPLKIWVGIFRGLWLLGFSKNTESLAVSRKRAKLATRKLIELAKQHDTVLLVGHGVLNYYIAKELLLANWRGSLNPGRKYWEFGTYQNHCHKI